jgi:DNA-binding MarR family transcriptional regulator
MQSFYHRTIIERYGLPVTASSPPRNGGIAFLLAQLGSHAAQQFGAALAAEGLTPALAGIMRLLRVEPGLSQQQLAERLGTVPSRIVGYVDDLEARGWISRARDPGDRRVNVLTVTAAGGDAFRALATVARGHERRITAGLDDQERAALLALLTKLAAAQELTPGVHPGYRSD